MVHFFYVDLKLSRCWWLGIFSHLLCFIEGIAKVFPVSRLTQRWPGYGHRIHIFTEILLVQEASFISLWPLRVTNYNWWQVGLILMWLQARFFFLFFLLKRHIMMQVIYSLIKKKKKENVCHYLFTLISFQIVMLLYFTWRI